MVNRMVNHREVYHLAAFTLYELSDIWSHNMNFKNDRNKLQLIVNHDAFL